MKVVLCFTFLVLVFSQVFAAVSYQNPERLVAQTRVALDDDFVRDRIPIDDDVGADALLPKGHACEIYTHQTSSTLKCKRDLVCIPNDLTKCAVAVINGSSFADKVASCLGTCQDYVDEGAECNSDAGLRICKYPYFCNMNKNGLSSNGVCTSMFSVEKDEVASSYDFCKYGLVLATSTSTATKMYERREITRCVEPSVMTCNATLTVGSTGCKCGSSQEGYDDFDCQHLSKLYACKKDDDDVNTCKFLADSCESEYKDFVGKTLKQNHPLMVAIAMDQPSSQHYYESTATSMKNLFLCADKINYQSGNPANFFQSSAASLSVSLFAFFLAALSLFF